MPKTLTVRRSQRALIFRERLNVCTFSVFSHCQTVINPLGQKNKGKRGCCDNCYQILWNRMCENKGSFEDFVKLNWMNPSKRDLNRRIDKALESVRRAS